MFKALKWKDWAGVGLGVWLLAAPWLFGFTDQTAASMNALLLGAILVIEKLLELGMHESGEEWIDIGVGLWLIVAPFVLGFASHTAAAVNTVAVGLLTVLFAAFALSKLDEKVDHWWHDRVKGH